MRASDGTFFADRERLIAAALVAGAGFLLCELRFEHREALGEAWQAWVPLAYAGATLAIGGVALLRWHQGGRRLLAALFAAGIAVGLAGLWFHTGGHPLRALFDVIGAWRLAPGQNGGVKIGSRPPALAPLAFCGLGSLGVLVCGLRSAPRLQQDRAIEARPRASADIPG